MSTVVKVQQTVESVGKPKQCDVNIACSETLWNTVQVQHKEAIAVPLKLAIFLTSEDSHQYPFQNTLTAHGKGYM